MWAYQAFTVTWLVFGLGYIFMIVTVIADNLRKPARKAVKKFRVAEQKVLSNKILQELLDMREQDRWPRYLPNLIDSIIMRIFSFSHRQARIGPLR